MRPPPYSSVRTALMLAAIGMVVAASPAWAGNTGGADMPWNAPLQTVLSNLTGPTGRTLAALMFVIGGAIWGFTRHEEGAKKFGQAIFGIAIMLGAVQIVSILAFAGALI
jgi:type IV secretion system protein TrbC